MFERDRFTWLTYGMLGFFGYLQVAPGAAMPQLRADLDLSYTVGGMHVSAMALGSIIAGLVTERVVLRGGRGGVFWGGGAGMALGALLLAIGPHAAITITAALIMGIFGTAMLITIQSGLADRHGEQRAQALTEANVVASASTILPALLIGGFERLSIGWRAAFMLMIVVWGLAFVTLRDTPIPNAAPSEDEGGGGRLPRLYWTYWLALALVVAVEWAIVAWGAEFMTKDLADADASLAMSAFFVAMMGGRFTGSRLTRRAAVENLLFGAMAVGLGGFLVFWLAPWPALMVLGLFVAGLGVANLFPFLLSLSVGVAPRQSDRASSRVTLGAGSAILLAPQALGTIADVAGLQAAYGLVLGIFALAGLVAGMARLQQRGS